MHSASNSTIDPIAANTAAAKIAGNVAASSPRFPSSSSLPADCGRRLLTKVVDEYAVTDPTRVYAAAPVSNDVRDGWVDITYRTLAIAVSRCARWIEKGIGRGNGKDVLFYMGPTDLRFPIVFLAALKTGRVAQFSSTRNSLDAHLSLLENSGCKSILLPDDAPNIASNILSRRTMQVVKAPTLKQLLEPSDDERENEIYEWKPEFESLRLKTCLILHTSGSTGIPKPVWVTHGAFASNDMHQLIPSLGGRPTFLAENLKQKRVLVAFPLFHAACVTLVVGFGIFHGAISVIPPPGPLTVDIVDRAHTHGNVEGSLMAPSLIVDIYKKPEAYQNLIENVKWIGYTGGPLPAKVGDELSRHIKVVTLIGSTETLFLPTENVDEPENWQQVPISPFLGHEYRPTGDGSAELMIVRNKELEKFQGCFCTLPDKTEHSMGDLYTQHPSNPRYWSFAARADDLIAFSTAEKLNPVTIESSLSAHPLVKGALVAGHGQFQASLLVEPNGSAPRTKKEKDAFINELWPAIMEINRSSVAHGRIMKGYILVTSQDRPFVRVPKGVIQRKETLKLYAKEFEALYESKDQTPDKKGSATSAPADEVRSHNTPSSGKKPRMSFSGACQDCSARKQKEEYTDAKIESLTAQLEMLSRNLDAALQRLETPSNQGLNITLSISMNGQDVVGSRSGNINVGLPQPTRSIAAPAASYERATNFPRQQSLPAPQQQEKCADGEPRDPAAESSAPPKLDELAELKDTLFEVIQDNAILYKLTASANLFNCGMDSQQVIVVTDAVNERLSSTPLMRARRITKSDIYDNPTIEQLAVAMLKC